jgi:hypothetical protein
MADQENKPDSKTPQQEPTFLSPYLHELNAQGTDCAEDCAACRWFSRTGDAPWNPPKTAA